MKKRKYYYNDEWKEKTFTKERSKKLSESLKRYYNHNNNNPMCGFQKEHKINNGRKKLEPIWNKGLTKETDERIMKISKSNKGHKTSEETKRKISKSIGGKNHPFYGKSHTKETKIKMRKNNSGKNNPMYGKVGNKNPSWKGGISFEPYDKGFNNIFKRRIRKRDNQVCMFCGIHREKLKRALDVHHINYDKQLTIPQNCISLCRPCHIKTNHNRKSWIKLFQDILIERYNYEYKENKPIIKFTRTTGY